MKHLLELLEKGTSPYQAVEWGSGFLKQKGFLELDFKKPFALKEGGRYFVKPYPSALFAFTVGREFISASGEGDSRIKAAMAHTDFPCFKIKSNPEYTTRSYLQVNVEPYGGMLKSTWFDRPLGAAGKVVLASEDVYAPETVYSDGGEPLFVIPSLAPHMDREANQKREYDMQQELQPIAGMVKEQCEKNEFLIRYLAEKLQVPMEDILAFDLFLYNTDKPEMIGLNQEFLSAPRIDNLASVAALLEAIDAAVPKKELVMAACFDNEEIGSRSKQGADSMLLPLLFDKIEEGLRSENAQTAGKWKIREALLRGFLLSVDGAHALHPNYAAKSDPTNEVFLGKGPVIKTSASQRYLSDSESTAILKQLCRKNGISCQIQVNRSGMPGGQTLGPIAASYLPMQGADVGLPMLAMHSARELAAGSDYQELVKLIKGLFEEL